jgi:alginate O-acetyltransferase complex protein AlgI
MLFNSLAFALFFPIVTVLFFVLPHRYRWFLLLLASCFFYMFFKPIYILILFFTIFIDYYAGLWIERETDPQKKKGLLALSIVANVGVLVVFKYYNFIIENLNSAFEAFQVSGHLPILNILLPIGLSFHTFQAMSYTIEVYRGNQKAEKHFGIYALYVMFYPQLVAGPIERPQNILHQFHEVKQFDYENFRSGLLLMAWGFFKKCVIADRLALFVNQVYGNSSDYEGIPLLVAIVFFSFQIFCDFSGYSDIAIGSARCMGYQLMTNFDRPYLAKGISEFWRRWHISLSSWFKDYVYIPLGGNRVSKFRWYSNLIIVFTLSGVWHGANWTFFIWGALHGLYLIIENELNRSWPSFYLSNNWILLFVKRVMVFSLVSFSWIFFRAANVQESLSIITKSFSQIPHQINAILTNHLNSRLHLLYISQPAQEFFLALAFISIMIGIHYAQGNQAFEKWILGMRKRNRWSFYYFLVICVVLFGVFNRSEFIYFQF